ncbi:hypothetical protein LbFV_ORF63 [Leptopilina boulardi filamentous virus]|uniref:Baculoviridae p74 N-terminal domain-containing protein n=1 Tax=Leptopilina boulardi filamentous virus TaxID=552509 RepID=A0A1S5YD34_9VIRU|nr:hypothetical protein LbFV_ORF63 [Leptopilina boulardi filamentous virus]AQQ79983.1 hypothetical protein LbFV_ORF63 [Leptopilina boulardi filamentous virus]
MYFTTKDSINANKYVIERQKILLYNIYLKKVPHIFSYVIIEIHPFKDIMKNVKKQFIKNCIYVRLKSSKIFCKKCKCNLHYPRGNTCNKQDDLIFFKSGNSDLTACETSCFNLYPYDYNDKTIANDSSIINTPLTLWSERCDSCIILASSIYNMGIDDYMRSQEHTVPHIDTIGTGYDIDDKNYIQKKTFNETIHFKINKYYCDDLDRTLINNKCDTTTGEDIAGFFLGDTIFHLLKYSFTKLVKGKNIYTVNEPSVPKVDELFKESEIEFNKIWKTDINKNAFFLNPNVTLEDLGFSESTMHMYWTTEHDNIGGGLKEPLLVYSSIIEHEIPYNLRIDKETGRRYLDEYEVLNFNRSIITIPPSIGTDDHEIDLYSYILSIVEEISKVGALLITQYGLETITKYVLKNIVPIICKETLVLTNRILFSTLLRQITVKITLTIFIKSSISIILKTSKLILASIPIIDIILLVTTLLDIILSNFDILKEKNINMSQEGVDTYSDMEILFKKYTMGFGTPEWSPILFITYYKIVESDCLKKSTTTTEENVIDKLNVLFNINEIRKKDAKKNKEYNDFFKTNISYSLKEMNDIINNEMDIRKHVSWNMEYLKNILYNSNGSLITWTIDQKLEKSLNRQLKNIDENEEHSHEYINSIINLEKIHHVTATFLNNRFYFFITSYIIVMPIFLYIYKKKDNIYILLYAILLLMFIIFCSYQQKKIFESNKKMKIINF